MLQLKASASTANPEHLPAPVKRSLPTRVHVIPAEDTNSLRDCSRSPRRCCQFLYDVTLQRAMLQRMIHFWYSTRARNFQGGCCSKSLDCTGQTTEGLLHALDTEVKHAAKVHERRGQHKFGVEISKTEGDCFCNATQSLPGNIPRYQKSFLVISACLERCYWKKGLSNEAKIVENGTFEIEI